MKIIFRDAKMSLNKFINHSYHILTREQGLQKARMRNMVNFLTPNSNKTKQSHQKQSL